MAYIGDKSFSWSWRARRRQKMADDALFAEGNCVIGDAVQHIMEPCWGQDIKGGNQFSCEIGKCGQQFTSVIDYEMHYSNVHRNTCSTCRRHFPNTHLLELHILESHNPMFDTLALTQNMFSCYIAECGEKFPSATVRRRHLVDVHKYPTNFRFDTHKKKEVNKKTAIQRATQQQTDMKVNNLISTEAMDTDIATPVQTTPVQTTPVQATPVQKRSSVSESGRRFVYNVPKNICFGQGSQRGFSRGRGDRGRGRGRGQGRGKKHWHQTGTRPNTQPDDAIDQVNMADLSTALETS